MKVLVHILITVSVSVISIYIYDKKFVRTYTDYNMLSVSDSLDRTRIQFGEFGSHEVKKYGFGVFDRDGNQRLFYGVAINQDTGLEEPQFVMYDSNGSPVSMLIDQDSTVMFSVGPPMKEKSVLMTSNDTWGALTVYGEHADGNTNEILLIARERPSLVLFGGENRTALHTKENEKSIVVVRDKERVWTSPK